VSEHRIINWTEADKARSARWCSESGMPPPRRVVIADDTMKADHAYRMACEGTMLLWRGDFRNVKQLLLAMSRRWWVSCRRWAVCKQLSRQKQTH
jgi:hypothetical protein